MKNEFRKPLASLRAIGRQLAHLREMERVDVRDEEEFYRGIVSKIASAEIERIRKELENPDNSPARSEKLMGAYREFVEQDLILGLGRGRTPTDPKKIEDLYNLAQRSYEEGNLGVASQSLERAVRIVGGMDKFIPLRKDARELIRDSKCAEDKEYSGRFFEGLNGELAETIDWNVKLMGLQGKVQRRIDENVLRNLRLRKGGATRIAAGALAVLAFFGAEAYYLRGDIASKFGGSSRPAAVTPIDYSPRVIIANGVGSPVDSSKGSQIKSLEEVFEAYKLYNSRAKTELFVSNPYGIPIPKDVKVKGIATTENILDAIEKSRGKTSVLFLSPEGRYSVGMAGSDVESNAYFQVMDGTIYPQDLAYAMAPNSADFLVTNIPNWKFVKNIFQYNYSIGGLEAKRPKNLTGIMLKEGEGFNTMASIYKSFQENPKQKVENLLLPYIEKGMYVNQFEQPGDLSQSPAYRAPLFPDKEK